MENTQRTYVGQVNSSVSQLAGLAPTSEGAAFAAANPPANPERFGVVSKETPGNAVDVVDHTPSKMTPENVKEVLSAVTRPRRRWMSLPICGVVTIKNSEWRPRKVVDIPHSITQGMGMSLSAHFALVYNQSDTARTQRRWAVVTSRGTVLILSGIPDADRPTNPAAFPPCVQSGLSYDQAELAAGEANALRFKFAAVPREWSIALRRADCVDDVSYGLEGGDA